MVIDEIASVLKHGAPDQFLGATIHLLKQKAVEKEDEVAANELWCYEAIHTIQMKYHAAYTYMQSAANASSELEEDGWDSPKSKAYEEAWNALNYCDVLIGALQSNYCLRDYTLDVFRIPAILADIHRLQSLFPYRFFLSRETLVYRSECSICGQTVRIRRPCGHVKGRVYMGKLCQHRITKAKLIAISVVTDPYDKYTILKLNGTKFNFLPLDHLISKIKPYMDWSYEVEERLLPQYMHIDRNQRCPCGSGSKFKNCIRTNHARHYKLHFQFRIG